MKIKPFEMERWQSVWENRVELNISESGVKPMTLEELVDDPVTLRRVLATPLGYPQTNGSEETRTGVASLYPGARAENVLLTNGGSEANYVSTWLLVEPFAHDRLEDNLNPVGRMYYAASTMLCTPNSLSQHVGAALGAQAGETRLRNVATEAGFTRFRRAAETPFNLVFEARG